MSYRFAQQLSYKLQTGSGSNYYQDLTRSSLDADGPKKLSKTNKLQFDVSPHLILTPQICSRLPHLLISSPAQLNDITVWHYLFPS